MLSQTPTRPKYRGVPASATTEPTTNIIFSGKPNTPFVKEIATIEQLVEDCRTSISRYINTWNTVWETANAEGDDHMRERAQGELAGLYRLLDRIRKAGQ